MKDHDTFWDIDDFQTDAICTDFGESLPPDYATDAHPWREQTLEQALAIGKTAYDMATAHGPVTLHECPAALLALIHNLVPKLPDQRGQRKSEEAVFQLLTKLGACKLILLPEVHLLGRLAWTHGGLEPDWVEEYETVYEMLREAEIPPYILDHVQFRSKGQEWSVPMFGWVQDILYRLASNIETPPDEVAVLAIIAAISCSEEYVPLPIVSACRSELKRFQLHIRATWSVDPDYWS